MDPSDTITVEPGALERKLTIPEQHHALVREFRDAHAKGHIGRDGVRKQRQIGPSSRVGPLDTNAA